MTQVERLLREYLEMARDNRHTWAYREGDEADYKMRLWQRKIEEIEHVLRQLSTLQNP